MYYRVAIEIFDGHNWLTLRAVVVESEEEVEYHTTRYIGCMKEMKKHNRSYNRPIRIVSSDLEM